MIRSLFFQSWWATALAVMFLALNSIPQIEYKIHCLENYRFPLTPHKVSDSFCHSLPLQRHFRPKRNIAYICAKSSICSIEKIKQSLPGLVGYKLFSVLLRCSHSTSHSRYFHGKCPDEMESPWHSLPGVPRE